MIFLDHDEIVRYFHHCKCKELCMFLISQLSGFQEKRNAICKVYTTQYYAKEREAHSGISKDIYKSSKGQKHIQVCQQLLLRPRNLCRYAASNV